MIDAIDSVADPPRETVMGPIEEVRSPSTAADGIGGVATVDDEQAASLEEPTAVTEDIDERTDDIES